MLVIRRRKGEVIRINGDIAIKVIECGQTNVRIGISAPDDDIIWREECPKIVSGKLHSCESGPNEGKTNDATRGV